MTKQQYEHWSSPYRNTKGKKIIITADKWMTGIVFLAYPILLGYLLFTGNNQKLMQTILVPAVSFVIVSVFRRCYTAPRPYELLDIEPLIEKDTKGRSFPSRHVFSIFIIGMTFFYIAKPIGIVIGIMGIAMAYIRVVGGVHFPKDVVAGAVTGILCGMMYYIIQKFYKKNREPVTMKSDCLSVFYLYQTGIIHQSNSLEPLL